MSFNLRQNWISHRSKRWYYVCYFPELCKNFDSQVLYYDRIYISEGNDVNKTSELKERNICPNLYFSDK